jgi:hypothetical protein
MIKHCLCALGLSLALGCATVVVRPYVGEQQTWPTANGSICNVQYDLPVFTTLPPSSYEVLAELRIESPFYPYPSDGHLKGLVKSAVKLGADALVLVDGQAFFSNQYGLRGGEQATGTVRRASVTQVNRFNPQLLKPNVNIVAIRWVAEPPLGLPSKYAKYSEKIEGKEPPPVPVEPAPESVPAPEHATTEVTTPVPPAPPKTESETPAPPAMPPPPPAAPATPEPPPAEAPPAAATPPAEPPLNLYVPPTPKAAE